MDAKSFLIGIFTAYFVGFIVSSINFVTNKALYYRKLSNKMKYTDSDVTKAKADTVRMIHERLKGHLEKPELPWDSFTVAEEVIDQIAKDMLEEL